MQIEPFCYFKTTQDLNCSQALWLFTQTETKEAHIQNEVFSYTVANF